jgi:spore maturation protein CgeB
LAKVQHYLTHEDLRQRVAEAGCDRCKRSGYSHHDRLKVMLDHLGVHEMVAQR